MNDLFTISKKGMEDLQIFKNQEFGVLRIITINNEPYFVGKDIAKILGYSNPQKALRDHVDIEDKTVNDSFTVNGTKGILINESGLYSLILSSKLPSAKKFKRWVTSEVLPTIRQTGGYINDTCKFVNRYFPQLSNEQKQAITILLEESQRMNQKIIEDAPKVIFADAVNSSETAILIGDLAKILCQNGINIGQNRLFSWLRKNGFLISSGDRYNMPTQKAMNMKLFYIKETTIKNADGSFRIVRTPKVTGKGQNFFINKFLGEKLISLKE